LFRRSGLCPSQPCAFQIVAERPPTYTPFSSSTHTHTYATTRRTDRKWEEFKAKQKEWNAWMDEERKVRDAERKARQEEYLRKL
jgi:hypothetical protein